jgi:hypothetical protein
MTYIVEFIDSRTEQFRAVRVECDDPKWLDVELMKQHKVEPAKILKSYPEKSKHQ